VKERLPIAISVAALVVAVLGSTGLGEAAQNGVTAGASKAKRATGLGAEKSSARRGPRGPRGYRGYRGYRGLRGFQGPPGDKGDKGDQGPNGTDAFELVSSAPITVTGTTFETGATVLTMPLAAGKYIVTALVTIEGTGDGTAVCRARAPAPTGTGWAGTAKSRIGAAAGSSESDTLTIVFGAPLTEAGAVHLRCWEENGTPTDPTATASKIAAVKVGNLTQSGS
jgi:hypothetical protein